MLSPKVFTQISSGSTHWMKNLIPHLRSTNVAYFDRPCYVKNEKYMKKHDYNYIFHVFLIFHVAGSIESMQHGPSLYEELNFASNEYSHPKFE